MNKGTTDSYFPFFGVPYHLILRGKISGLGNEALEIWLSGGGGGLFFWFRRESEKSMMVKLNEKTKMTLLIQWHTYNL